MMSSFSRILFLGFLAAALAHTALAQEPEASLRLPARARAVRETASRASSCQSLGDFYWEIGNGQRMLASGRIGARYDADQAIAIASASKWVFGAYVLERTHGAPTPGEIDALTMRSGFVSFRPLPCALAGTVSACFAIGGNGRFTAADVGKFFYGGGHDEKLAIDLGLGALTREGLAGEMRRVLGDDLDFGYATPDLAGGMSATPSAYGSFLRKILRHELRMAGFLDAPAVCTLPESCASALHSPAPVAWHYGINHWIEDDPGGDGAFSSAGAFGFYPWITADRSFYGLLARHSYASGASFASAACGQRLRQAWASGQPQRD
jgi:hypothetical protein